MNQMIIRRSLSTGKRKYVLAMFPYPSGSLHMGHVRVYAISEVLARTYKMKGYEVLHPMGWDAFGLPAENAARDHGKTPESWTQQNIEHMRAQLRNLGFSFTNNMLEENNKLGELNTSDASYFRWTQWLFLQLQKYNLAYRAKSEVNWDPIDKTVLANEQVDNNGISWRSGAVVQKRDLEQWFIRVTDYAPSLLANLDQAPIATGWPSQVREMQRQWIGRSKGHLVNFPILSKATSTTIENNGEEGIKVFTTRVDTLNNVLFIALSRKHPLVSSSLPLHLNIRDGTKLDFCKVVHPITKNLIPVFVADYVLDSYGEGAVMGVPIYDERDAKFANTHGIKFNLSNPEPLLNEEEVLAMEKANICKPHESYRLRDWLVSRQRRWGAPVPMIHCHSGCGPQPVREHELPVPLPPRAISEDDVLHVKRGLKNHEPIHEWLSTKCPKCGGPAHRDPDTLDTFVDSSWYFYRFCAIEHDKPMDLEKAAFSKQAVEKWMGQSGVNVYVGGIEHAILHLLYSRFIHHFLLKHQIIESKSPEPFEQLVTQGMVLGKTYKEKGSGRYLKTPDPNADIVWEKMSKSKFNGVNPLEVVAKYGSDSTRLAVLFAAPPEKSLEWDLRLVEGQSRFLKRVRNLALNISAQPNMVFVTANSTESDKMFKRNQTLINAIRRSIEHVSDMLTERRAAFNTAISELMKLSNALGECTSEEDRKSFDYFVGVSVLLRMLAPFAPEATQEIWRILPGNEHKNIHEEPWPTKEELRIPNNEPEISSSSSPITNNNKITSAIFLIGGKRRSSTDNVSEIPSEIIMKNDQEGLLFYARKAIPKLDSMLASKTVDRIVVIPSKNNINATKNISDVLINIVLK